MEEALGFDDSFAAVLTEGGGLLVFGEHNRGMLGLGPPTGNNTPDQPISWEGSGRRSPGARGGGPGRARTPFATRPS